MSWFLFGSKKAAAEPPTITQVDPRELLRTEVLKRNTLAEELKLLNVDIQAEAKRGNKLALNELIVRQRQLQIELKQLDGKIANMRSTQDTISTAEANHQQALMMRDGASKLSAIQKQTEKIDLDDIVDTYQDAAQLNVEHSDRLSTPIFNNSGSVYGGQFDNDVDDEVTRLLAQASDEQVAVTLLTSPSPPTTTTAPTKISAVTVSSKRRQQKNEEEFK